MDNLFIERTPYTPAVHFDYQSGSLQISGNSFPKNPKSFYDPILEWTEHYILKDRPNTKVDFKLDYISSNSRIIILRLLKLVKLLKRQQNNTEVTWHYHSEDEEIFNEGKRLAQISKLNLNFASYS